jgi:AcrR family transcriptional regulator
MPSETKKASRGRPRTITKEKILNAGIKIGLLNITFVGVATELGISHMALYKHVASVEALKYMVAEEIFLRWQIPSPKGNSHVPLQQYLIDFMHSMRELVKSNAGITPYVIRRMASTPSMVEKINQHHVLLAEAYNLSLEHARILNSTIAFHCIAVADTVYSVFGEVPIEGSDRALEEAEMENEFIQSMHALIIGILASIS